MSKVKAIPDGYYTLTPYLVVRDAAKAIDFYKKAFNAEEICRMPSPDGKVMHAEIKIGNSLLMLSDENVEMNHKSPQTLGGTAVSIHIYVEDAHKAYEQAIQSGATQLMPVSRMFWGDDFGKLHDPYGHSWSIATHKEDLTPEETEQRMKEAFKQMAGCGQK